MTWPSVWEVHAYRCQVYNLVCEVIASAPDHAIANIGMDSPYWALPMAFEHDRVHVETSRCTSTVNTEQPWCGSLVLRSKQRVTGSVRDVLRLVPGACALYYIMYWGHMYRDTPRSTYRTQLVVLSIGRLVVAADG